MRPPRVWFNEALSQIGEAARLIGEVRTPLAVEVLLSHSDPSAPALHIPGCETFAEPNGVDDAAYMHWALGVCSERRVGLLVPGRRVAALAGARARFAERGVRVLAPFASARADMDLGKAETHALAESLGIPVPACRLVTSAAELDAARAALGQLHETLCVKPDRGLFGAGFRILDPLADPFACLNEVPSVRIRPGAYRDALSATREPFRVVVMEYLPGVERSLDCLAHRGALVCAVARVKRGRSQQLDGDEAVIGHARRLVAALALDGVVNIQFREDARGCSKLLEVNPRMAGGVNLSSAGSGVNLPYWSVLLALGLCTPDAVPQPRPGARVAHGGSVVVWR